VWVALALVGCGGGAKEGIPVDCGLNWRRVKVCPKCLSRRKSSHSTVPSSQIAGQPWETVVADADYRLETERAHRFGEIVGYFLTEE